MIFMRALPGPSQKEKVRSLMESARDFMLFYAEFVKKAAAMTQEENDEDEDASTAVSVQKHGLLDGEVVVKQVLAFLEDLQRTVSE